RPLPWCAHESGFPADVWGLFLTRPIVPSRGSRTAPSSKRGPTTWVVQGHLREVREPLQGGGGRNFRRRFGARCRSEAQPDRQARGAEALILDEARSPTSSDRADLRYRPMRDVTLQQACLFRYPRAPAPGRPCPAVPRGRDPHPWFWI